MPRAFPRFFYSPRDLYWLGPGPEISSLINKVKAVLTGRPW